MIKYAALWLQHAPDKGAAFAAAIAHRASLTG